MDDIVATKRWNFQSLIYGENHVSSIFSNHFHILYFHDWFHCNVPIHNLENCGFVAKKLIKEYLFAYDHDVEFVWTQIAKVDGIVDFVMVQLINFVEFPVELHCTWTTCFQFNVV